MIRFDFQTYMKPFLDEEKFQKLLSEKQTWIEKLKSCNMIGWMSEVKTEEIEKIKRVSQEIRNNFDCLVVVGIGGSFLGSYAFHKMFQKYFKDDSFEIIYAGTTLSDEYLEELLDYLKDKNFCVNVISKSGTTMETRITYQFLKDLLKRKYSEGELKKHIILTTDKEKGLLREEATKEGYESFEIPEDIGGRYSFITPAHLLELAIHYDLDKIIDGYYDGKQYIDQAFEYAALRKCLFDEGKMIENYCVYEEKHLPFTEWLKQLFGETEGKNNVGIYPTSSLHTRDLHSLGQFIQEGNKIIFETFLRIEKSPYFISYKGNDLHELNHEISNSVMRAHYSGGVPCMEILLDRLDEETLSTLIYFFLLSAAFSGLLFGVDPFNQPGVEVYKKEIISSIGEL